MGTCNQNILKRIMKKASEVIHDTLLSSDQIYINNVVKTVSKIMTDTEHPFNNMYSFMRSNRRLRAISCRTKQYGSTFVPKSIHIFNNNIKSCNLLLVYSFVHVQCHVFLFMSFCLKCSFRL